MVYALFLLCLFWSGYFGLGPAFRFKDRIDHAGTRTRVGNLNNFIRLDRKNITMFFFLSGNSLNSLSRYEPPFSHSYIPFSLKVRWSTRSPYSFVLVCIAAPEEAGKVKFIIKIKLYIFTDSDQNLIIFISAQNLRFWSWILKIRFPAALGFVKHMFMWVRVPLTTELDSVLPGALCVSKE